MSDDLSSVISSTTRGIFYLATGNVVATLAQAVAVFIIARLLGPELYGVYTVALSVPLLIIAFIGFGIDESMVRFSANLREKGENQAVAKVIRLGITFKALIAIVVFIICFLLSDYIAIAISRPDYSFYIGLASVVIVFQGIFYSADAVFVSLDRTEYSALTANIQAIIKTLLTPLLIVAGLSVIGAITGFTISYVVAGLLGGGLVFIKLYAPLKNLAHKNSGVQNQTSVSLRSMLKYGFPIYIAVLLASAYAQLQPIILSFFTLDLPIGNFKAATNFGLPMVALSGSITTVLFPAFSKINSNINQARIVFKLATKYATLILVPVSLVVIVLSSNLVELVYGESFTQAPFFLSFYIMTYLLVGLGSLVQNSFFNGIGETMMSVKVNLVRFVVFIGLALPLTQAYSVSGLIGAILVSTLIATMFGAYIAKNRFGITLDYRRIFLVYVAAFISAVPLFFIASLNLFPSLVTIFLGGSIYLLVYLTLLPILGALSKSELANFRINIEKIRFLKFIMGPILKYENKLVDYAQKSNGA